VAAQATIDCSPPTEEEVDRAVTHLKNGKAPGLCNLPAKLLKNAGPDGIKWLTSVFQSAWQCGIIPEWFPIQSGVRQGCNVAPDLFLVPMDWLMERIVQLHRGMIGMTIGMKKDSFTDLDFADDVALLAEMLSVLLLALEVMEMEACPLGLTINKFNWARRKYSILATVMKIFSMPLFREIKWKS